MKERRMKGEGKGKKEESVGWAEKGGREVRQGRMKGMGKREGGEGTRKMNTKIEGKESWETRKLVRRKGKKTEG